MLHVKKGLAVIGFENKMYVLCCYVHASSNEQRLSCFICGKYLLVSCGGTSVLSEIGSATILKQYNEMNMCMALH